MINTEKKNEFIKNTPELKMVLSDIFKGAVKSENVKLWSKGNNHTEFHQIGWLLQDDHLDTVLKHFSANDLYISFNTFKAFSKRKKKKKGSKRMDLFNVYAFCIDVDYKAGSDHNISVLDAVSHIKLLFNQSWDNIIPCPAYIEYGNQFRLIYLLDGHLSTQKQFNAIDLVAKKIVSAINSYDGFDFHAETQPLNSFIRVAGSYNTKNISTPVWTGKMEWDEEFNDYKYIFDNTCPVIHYEKAYITDSCGYPVGIETRKTLGEYMEEVLGDWEKPLWYDTWKKSANSKKKVYSLSGLNFSRMNDINIIREYMQKTYGPKGYRAKLCFTYFIHAKLYFNDISEAYQATEAFNNSLTLPLTSSQLKNALCSAIHNNYTIKSDTILKMFGISEEKAKELSLQLALRHSDNKRYCKEYRQRQKIKKAKKGIKTKKQIIEKHKKTIIKLRKRHQNNKKIQNSLEISKKTMERYITQLIKAGRILSAKLHKKAEKVIEQKKEIAEEDFLQKVASACVKIGQAVEEKGENAFISEMLLFDQVCRCCEK